MKVTKNIFPLEWKLSDPLKVPYHGKKVFGTFVCGGGSTMGYKLAGYEHLGGVEFTEHYSKVYKANHNPKYFYLEDIRNFNKREDLPQELFDLDLLDGSPPCAAFSTSGAREKLWGKKSEYEGKQQQKDDLVFVYLQTIKKLMPKVFLLENVSGLIKGNAKAYVKKIFNEAAKIGYKVQGFHLNAASMGLPQIRSRVFFIGLRNDLKAPKLVLDFDCPVVGFGITEKYWNHPDNTNWQLEGYANGNFWEETKIGESHHKRFGVNKPHPDKPCPTILESQSGLGKAVSYHPYQKRQLNIEEVRLLSTFPLDYDFQDTNAISTMGRSVLPCMMANISHQIYKQWLSKIQ